MKANVFFYGSLLVLALGLSANPVYAAPSDPVEVEADQLDIDQRAGTAVYRGNVEIRQGEMRLRGDQVEIERNKAGELSRATAIGDRAYMRHRPDGQEELMEGKARRIIYHLTERRVELIGRAELTQAGDHFTGGRLEYFIDRKVVQARSDVEGSENQRIRMTLQPEQPTE
ncbi:lipopolysaccharide transport periplasmic protein LptA [Halomonas llamarensis]|uniref:Lipopolysaccharide export system protein LptA n=1 Tax=Halomonas llamarensis TaxID=2945104 RepID=A0ABT0SNC2_9GAMM|nr:lipopolysaccharide transport periplasmic protein LptA [Halomonas llamarensis]MCL7928909.1 lipopolysaccharide transport periplasmic protein LptA [Halomonas llamarensis]